MHKYKYNDGIYFEFQQIFFDTFQTRPYTTQRPASVFPTAETEIPRRSIGAWDTAPSNQDWTHKMTGAAGNGGWPKRVGNRSLKNKIIKNPSGWRHHLSNWPITVGARIPTWTMLSVVFVDKRVVNSRFTFFNLYHHPSRDLPRCF